MTNGSDALQAGKYYRDAIHRSDIGLRLSESMKEGDFAQPLLRQRECSPGLEKQGAEIPQQILTQPGTLTPG